MAQTIQRTNHATVIPTVWEPMFEYQAQAPRGIAEGFWDVSSRVQGPGNAYKINILPPLTVTHPFSAGDLRAWVVDGSVNIVSALTPNVITMNMTLKAVGITIEPDVEDYTVTGLADSYVPVLSEACYQGLDLDILNQYSDFNTAGDSVGATGVNFNIADFLLGLQRLRSNARDKYKGGSVMGIYGLAQLNSIFNSSDVVNAAVRGTGPGAAVNGEVPTIYGARIKLTNNVVFSTNRKNMLAMQKAIVWGKKYAAKIETDRQDLIQKVYAYCNWGVESAHSFSTYSSSSGKDLAVLHLTA